ncbi:protein of unknown function DUF641, plant [Dillenia turbinata]|uniref:DUF641 domain-containing protein n=1 Tax=Dillenia turbinata TaxID=194707 RepID=A0AAN8VH49_9MAGN
MDRVLSVQLQRDLFHKIDSVRRMAVTPSKSRLARTFAKVLHIRAVTGVAPAEGIKKIKPQEKVKDDLVTGPLTHSFDDEDEKYQDRLAMEALLAKVFASISTVKAAYAELQNAQFPYDSEGIQSADELVISELKNLSELKQCYLKKQFDFSPETALPMAEIKEQKSVMRTYETMVKKLESQMKRKDTQVAFLREKLEESKKHNRSLEKVLNSSGPLSVLDNLYFSGLNPSHFITVLRHTVKSIRSFVQLMVKGMESAGWDIDAAVNSIVKDVVYLKPEHKCFALESFVCREMFDGFHIPNFSLLTESLPETKKREWLFFDRFSELKSIKTKQYLASRPKSTFAKYCRAKYLHLVHPKMESSFFGNLNQRDLVNSGQFPETLFFSGFSEMAKRIWLLHCLAFSFEPEASIFQVSKWCRFSEVYMECMNEDVFFSGPESKPRVAFTVVPGFRIGKTVIQCRVYLSQPPSRTSEDHPTAKMEDRRHQDPQASWV